MFPYFGIRRNSHDQNKKMLIFVLDKLCRIVSCKKFFRSHAAVCLSHLCEGGDKEEEEQENVGVCLLHAGRGTTLPNHQFPPGIPPPPHLYCGGGGGGDSSVYKGLIISQPGGAPQP